MFTNDELQYLGTKAREDEETAQMVYDAINAGKLSQPEIDTFKGYFSGDKTDVMGVAKALGRGAAEGLTTELPYMFGKALEFITPDWAEERVGSPGQDIADWARRTGEKMYGPKPPMSKIEEIIYEGSKMLAPSVVPGGTANLGARALGAGSKAAMRIGAGTAAGMFGASQAQQTKDTANQRADYLESIGRTEEAQRLRESLAPYVTGGIEAAGEYLGTKYLSKLLGLGDEVVKGLSPGQMLGRFFKTLGVEVGTEMGQQAGEAGVEKYTAIRPDAQPLAEALNVVGPTTVMTLLTGGVASAGNMFRKTDIETDLDNRENAVKQYGNLSDQEDQINRGIIDKVISDPKYIESGKTAPIEREEKSKEIAETIDNITRLTAEDRQRIINKQMPEVEGASTIRSDQELLDQQGIIGERGQEEGGNDLYRQGQEQGREVGTGEDVAPQIAGAETETTTKAESATDAPVVPELTSSQDAVAFGEQATPEQVAELDRVYEARQSEVKKMMAENNPDAMEYAMKSQFYREASEVAKGTPLGENLKARRAKTQQISPELKDLYTEAEDAKRNGEPIPGKDVATAILGREMTPEETAGYYDAYENAKPIEKPKQKAIGDAWDGNKWRPIVEQREVTRGKQAGKIEVTFPDGKKLKVEPKSVRGSNVKYSAGRGIPTLETIDLKDVKKAARGKASGRSEDGSFWMQLPNNKVIHIENVKEITPDNLAFEVSYGRKLSGDEVVRGSVERTGKSYTIKISKGIGDRFTLLHETLGHLYEAEGLIPEQDRNALAKALRDDGKENTEENRAQLIESVMRDRELTQKYGTFTGRALQRIADIVDSIVNLFHRTARGVIRELEQPVKQRVRPVQSEKGGEAGIRYSIAPKEVSAPFGTQKKTVSEKLQDALTMIRTKEGRDAIATQTLDRLRPVLTEVGQKEYEKFRVLPSADHFLGILINHGMIKVDKNGTPYLDDKSGSLRELFDKAGKDWNKLPYWVAAKRAEQIHKEDDEAGLTGDDRRERLLTKDWIAKTFEWAGKSDDKKMNELAKELKAFNDSVLDYAVKMGLISEEFRNSEAMNKDFYIPFYRIIEDNLLGELNESVKGPFKSNKFISARIKKYTGSDKRMGDPLENLFRNWSHLLTEGLRNRARASVGQSKTAVESGVIEVIPSDNIRSFYNDKTKKRVYLKKSDVEGERPTSINLEDSNILAYQDKGKPVYIQVNDADLFEAMSNVNMKEFDNVIFKMLRASKKWLTYGATFGPAFRVANAFRDTVQTSLLDKSFKPVIDTWKGFISSMREDEKFIDFQLAGGAAGSSYVNADNPEKAHDYIKRMTKKEGRGTLRRVLDTPKKLLDFWEKVGAASEYATKVQYYQNLIEAGEEKTTAAFKARDVLDFAMSGKASAVQAIIQTVPFINARFQGLYKLGRAWNDKSNRKNFITRGMILTAATAALWYANKDDDRWKELEDWDKWSYYHFWIGDQHFRIPKPFEVGAGFSSFPETFLDAAYGNADTKHVADFVGHTMTQTFAIGVPQLFQPLLEQWANKSAFTGRPIVSQALQGLKAGEQAEPWTSETLRQIGKTFGISPKRAEALVQGYFATLGMGVLGASDIVFRNTFDFPDRPARRIDDYPLVGRFVKQGDDPRSTKYTTKFYDVFNEMDMINKTVNYYNNTGEYLKARDLQAANRQLLAGKPKFNKVRKQVSEINKQTKAIYKMRISDNEKKRRIDALYSKRNKLLKQAYEEYYRRKP